MFKGNIISKTSVSASTNIPLNVAFNTNCNTSYSNGVISINNPGYYEVDATVVVTGITSGNVSLQMYNDGVAVPEAIVSGTSSEATDIITLPLSDLLKICKGCCCNNVKLSFQLSVDATVNSAIVTVENVH